MKKLLLFVIFPLLSFSQEIDFHTIVAPLEDCENQEMTNVQIILDSKNIKNNIIRLEYFDSKKRTWDFVKTITLEKNPYYNNQFIDADFVTESFPLRTIQKFRAIAYSDNNPIELKNLKDSDYTEINIPIRKKCEGCTNLELFTLAWETTGDSSRSGIFLAENRGENPMLTSLVDEDITSLTHGDYTYTIIDDIDSLKNKGVSKYKYSVISTFRNTERDYKDGGVAVKVSFIDPFYNEKNFTFVTFVKHKTACEWVGVANVYLDFDDD